MRGFSMMMVAMVTGAAAAGCAADKPMPDDDFASLDGADLKSDAFSSHLRMLGALDAGTPRRVYYTKTPKFRGYAVTGDGPLDVWVRSEGSGDAVAWLLDAHFKVIAKNDDADDSTYDAHVTATIHAGKTYYLVMRDYDQKSGWFDVTRAAAADPELACTAGESMLVPDACMDDGGANAIGDALEIWCVHGVSRFCLSGEACPWRHDASFDDGTTCSRAGLGTDTAESEQYGLDFMAHATCKQWKGHEWYYCDADGQIHFADDGVR